MVQSQAPELLGSIPARVHDGYIVHSYFVIYQKEGHKLYRINLN